MGKWDEVEEKFMTCFMILDKHCAIISDSSR